MQTNDYRAGWECGVRWNLPICQMEFQLELKKDSYKKWRGIFQIGGQCLKAGVTNATNGR